jgi:excisionase family DNA binding protein
VKRKPIKKRLYKKRARPALASPEDAAKALGFSRNIVYELLRRRVLPASHIGNRYWIAWATIDRIVAGDLRLKMKMAA